jgi:uncharacterized protein (TIGR03084 family)
MPGGEAELLTDLGAEQEALQALLDGIDRDDWFRTTPAKGWDVRDTIAHLADTDEIAVDTCLGGPRPLNDLAARLGSAEDVTLAGVLRGRRLPGADVLSWWRRASARERDVLAGLDPDTRVQWGIGMKPISFLTARLMETWAHGLDVHAALGVAPVDTARLRHVAFLGYRALPYAFSRAEREAPALDRLRIELTGPDGDTWIFGSDDGPERITGPAGEFCRVFVQRLPLAEATGLQARGDAAVAALQVARAFL